MSSVNRVTFDAEWEKLYEEWKGRSMTFNISQEERERILGTTAAIVELLNRRLFGPRPKKMEVLLNE